MKKKDEPAAVLYVRYANIALSFGVSTALSLLFGFWAGRWLDKVFHSTPIFLVLGLLGGALFSFKSLFDMIGSMERLNNNAVDSPSKLPNEKRLSSADLAGNSRSLQENKNDLAQPDSQQHKPKP